MVKLAGMPHNLSTLGVVSCVKIIANGAGPALYESFPERTGLPKLCALLLLTNRRSSLVAA